MIALEARALAVHARGRALLDDVSLAVAAGECLAVLGANGAGKSTLLRRLAGDRLAGLHGTGSVVLDARPIEAWTPLALARRRAVLPQSPALAFGYTALELATLGRHAHGDAPAARLAIAREALRATDAAHLAGREVATLSGGERARAHLACALAQLWERECGHARCLLLDEPTAALDLAHQLDVLATVRDFARGRGIAVVAILHDPNLAAQYADRVLVLQAGARVAYGAPRAVLSPAALEAAFEVRAASVEHPLREGLLIAVARREQPAAAHASAPAPAPVPAPGAGPDAAATLAQRSPEGDDITYLR